MTIRELLMASMMSLVLGGCSISFMGTPTNSAPGYGYGSAGKPMSLVDYGQDDREKPLPRGSAKPGAEERDEPAKPPVRKKPAPQRTKPTQPADDTTDKPPTRLPTDDDSADKPAPTRRPTDSTEKPPVRLPIDRAPTTKPDPSPRKKPQPVRNVRLKPTR